MTRQVDDRSALLLDRLQGARTSHERGVALERLICLVFSRIPGVSVRHRNVYSDAGSQEIDVVLWNDQHPQGFWFLPPILFAEAKNWNVPVGSAEVAWFEAKVAAGGQTAGFLVTAKGITGDATRRSDALDVLFRAAGQGRRLIVLSAEDLVGLGAAGGLIEIVKDRLCRLAARVAPFGA